MSSPWRVLISGGLGLDFFFNSKDSHSNLNTRSICILHKYFPIPVLLKRFPPFPHTLTTPLTHWHRGLVILELKAGQRCWEVRMAVLVTTRRANPWVPLHVASMKDRWSPCYVKNITVFKIQDNSESGLCRFVISRASRLIVSWQLSGQMCSVPTKNKWVFFPVTSVCHYLVESQRSWNLFFMLSLAAEFCQNKFYPYLHNTMIYYGAAEKGLLAKFGLHIVILRAFLLWHMSEQGITYFLTSLLALQS